MGVTMFTDKSLGALRPRKTTCRMFEKSVDKDFCVQLMPAGGIYFCMQYQYMQYQSPVTGRRRFLPLGRYPTVTLAEARDELRAARSTLSAGRPPDSKKMACAIASKGPLRRCALHTRTTCWQKVGAVPAMS
jgi:hypothetical protein